MFKNWIVLSVLCFFALAVQAQDEDYLDEITRQSCECLDGISEDIDLEMYYMELGFCVIEASTPYQKELERDYGIDFDKIDTQGEQLGEIVGVRMTTICPKTLQKLIQKANAEDNGEPEPTTMSYEGKVTSVDRGDFLTLDVKNEAGKTTRFYWLTFVEADDDWLSDYRKLEGKSVQIAYRMEEFYDPKLEMYRMFYVLEALAVR
jgi:hypothetical protein